ncbi:MAG TPA: 16S rRNA (cytosine(1402)-N(4))-methyltransferase RsmH [Candidatus Kapabacteria bacterium]|nr:16S rRNA (cytosine(1402)-N(4))-methyltransferase RsmH [Candidatus Kapabacteria bacterium]
MRHDPVLLAEVVDALSLAANKHIVDCTLGDGGHTEAILAHTGPEGRVLGIDADPESLLRAKKYLYAYGDRVVYARDNFEHLTDIVAREHFGPIHGILMDFGWSSPQFEDRGRGFSFQKDEPLDMRYDPSRTDALTAETLVNTKDEQELVHIFSTYGEEKLSKEIARNIVLSRKEQRIQTTGQLVSIILETYRKKLKTEKEVPWVGGLHPATKVFQALRIVVNDELGVIERVLPQAIGVLETGGRIAVITFHSLEDRLVKHFFKSEDQRTIRIITKKPIEASAEEVMNNTRAGSAKLRVVEKI